MLAAAAVLAPRRALGRVRRAAPRAPGGQPETLVGLERMESVPLLLRGRWEEEHEEVFLRDLESA
ncbi:hypothetical protein LUR56_15780 [Streptomyces sp. MT29]|nr:hypothetical protein [Streptomyces sp. MT29]